MANIKIDTGIVRRGDSYRFTVSMGYDVTGKQIRKTTTWTPPEGTTEKKADKLAKEEYLNFKNKCKGLSAFNENMRFKDLVEEYFSVYAPNMLKPITAYNYEKMVNYHFMGDFGNKKLKDISPGLITSFYNSHTTTTKEGKVKTLTYPNAKKLYTIMQSVFSFAVSQNYIKETPCKNIILPSKNVKGEEDRKFMTEDELSRFLPMFDEYSSFNVIIKMLLYTGMRSGECLGLQWSDIDFTNNTIHVVHTLTDVGGRHFLTTPKTKNSKRYIGMNSTVSAMLREHKKHQIELQMALKDFEHPEMIFTSATGNYKDRSCLNTSFKRFLKGTEFEFLTLHSLRHCNATLLLNSGVDIKIVSEHLGHSDINVTADIYADVLASTRQKTAEILEFKLAK